MTSFQPYSGGTFPIRLETLMHADGTWQLRASFNADELDKAKQMRDAERQKFPNWWHRVVRIGVEVIE